MKCLKDELLKTMRKDWEYCYDPKLEIKQINARLKKILQCYENSDPKEIQLLFKAISTDLKILKNKVDPNTQSYTWEEYQEVQKGLGLDEE